MAGATLALAISHLTQGQLPVTLVEAIEPGSRAHPGLTGGRLRWRRGPASSWRPSISGRRWHPAPRLLPTFTLAIVGMRLLFHWMPPTMIFRHWVT